MKDICSHYFKIIEQYFPKLAVKFNNIRNSYHSPHVGNSHAANLFTTHNFASAVHLDSLDATYAFGVWYDVGNGSNADSVFVFPEFKVAIQPHNGICALWNSEKVLHCTTKSSPHQNLRIGTVIQMSKTLNTKAKKVWEAQK